MYKILLVDDDEEVMKVNQMYFEQKDCRIFMCADATNAVGMIRKSNPDCVLLDIMMPKMNGYELCCQIRTFSNIPVLFLSGRISEESKIRGFDCGADDYMEKPYSLNELYIRIISNIKRNRAVSNQQSADNLIRIYPMSVDIIAHKVYCREEEIYLSNREYDLLLLLIREPGRLVTFEEIGRYLWNSYSDSDRRAVMVVMSRLRKKFSVYQGMENMIETVYSKGYKISR